MQVQRNFRVTHTTEKEKENGEVTYNTISGRVRKYKVPLYLHLLLVLTFRWFWLVIVGFALLYTCIPLKLNISAYI